MTAATFDTHAAVTIVHDAITGDVATKADVNHLDGRITQLEKNVSAKLQQLEDKTDAKHARLEARMYRALWMQAGAIVAAVVALMKLLPRAAVRPVPPTAVGVFLERQARCARLS